MRRVVVTGLGLVSPLGIGVRANWTRLLKGRSGIVALTDPAFQSSPSRVAGLLPNGSKKDNGWDSREWISAQDERRMAKFTQLAIAASTEAIENSGWTPNSDEERQLTGVCFGSGIGNLEEIYDTSIALKEGGYKRVSALFVPRLLINMAAGHIGMRNGFQGPNHSVTTACTTGAHAIGDAARLIAWGDADVMIAGAAESCIHPLAVAGFARARSLATDWNEHPSEASRPFDRNRSGFVIGEGAGAVVLEEYTHAKARGAVIYAELKGYGLSGDAHHMTAPREDGQGAFLAMRRALGNAGVQPGDVDYVNAHATSTVIGDAAENRAIKRLLLGDHGKQTAGDINVSSTKGAIGHLLGAAGAVEAIFTILAISNGILPPTVNLKMPGDPAEDFDCNYVPNSAQQKAVSVALTNSFGFGEFDFIPSHKAGQVCVGTGRQEGSDCADIRHVYAVTAHCVT